MVWAVNSIKNHTPAPSADQTEAPPAELSPGLYIVATPIGNLGDITLRAIATLRGCDVIACEDTRVTGKLLKHLGIKRPLLRYNDHSGEDERAEMLDRMANGAVALVSDAGTPLISDPGYRLVREAGKRGIKITSLPGPCAAIAGLTLSGLPTDRFFFAGFMPAKDKARADVLNELGAINSSLVFYETGPRLLKTLAVIEQTLGQRPLAIAREISKLHEECRWGSAKELQQYWSDQSPKGEIVLMIGPPAAGKGDDALVESLLRTALTTMKPSQAAAQVAKETGRERRAVYALAIALSNELADYKSDIGGDTQAQKLAQNLAEQQANSQENP